MVLIWILIILLLWSFLEQKMLTISRYQIQEKDSEETSQTIKFVVLADLHNRTFGKKNEKLIKRIDEIKPDFIIVAGDLITKQEPCVPGDAYSLLESLAGRYPIYYGYGNHEQYLEQLVIEGFSEDKKGLHKKMLYTSWLEYKKQLKKLGIHLLDNESDTLVIKNVRLNITGINIDRAYYGKKAIPSMNKDYLECLVGEKKNDDVQILIAHNPVYFKEYQNWGADLVLSGHLHGGLIRLPLIGGIVSPQYKFFPRYDAGKFSDNGHHMIVSRGLGSHSIMLRLFNFPELVVVQLKPKDKKIKW